MTTDRTDTPDLGPLLALAAEMAIAAVQRDGYAAAEERVQAEGTRIYWQGQAAALVMVDDEYGLGIAADQTFIAHLAEAQRRAKGEEQR